MTFSSLTTVSTNQRLSRPEGVVATLPLLFCEANVVSKGLSKCRH
jgi:hypothetical protein